MTREDAIAKTAQLQEFCQWAARAWISDCFSAGHPVRVLEVYRPQSRQNALYAKGRTAPGKIVTWTLNSLHTKKLAMDVEPLRGDWKAIDELAKKYNIRHPLPFDLYHFEFDKAMLEPARTYSPAAQIKRIKRGLQRASGNVRIMLERQMDRLLARVDPGAIVKVTEA